MRSDQSQGIRNPFAAAHLRKFMSIVLTVCMILTIMPVNYAAAATVTETKNVTSADVTISDASKNYTITGGTQETPAQHSVVVSPNLGTVNITLKDVNIAFDTTPVGCAFSIGAGTTVNLTLSGNSVLTSNGTFAGLHVPEGAVLNITAPDTNSTLGATGNGSGAGIGGNSGESCGKVTISNGTVNGAGVTAAGIGGGKNGGAGELTITGGRVSGLTCTDGVSDIGCGQGGSGGRVTVSGGFVHAARNLMIGGTGTVNTFTGGSICANTVTPTPTDGTQNVYRTQIELPSADNNTVITYKVGNGSTCSADAGTQSNLYYLWLPQNNDTAVTITGTDGTKTYKAGGSVYESNTNTLEFYKDLAITAQPAPETTVTKKAAASLTVTADGSYPSYEWHRNTSQSTEGGTLAEGSGWNASSYTLPTDVVGTAYYYCVVKSKLGGFSDTKTTNIVKVTVTPNTETPFISPSMSSQYAIIGKTATFTTQATVSDGGTLSYKWQKSTANTGPWTDVTTGTGYNTASYTTAPAAAADSGAWYQCIVTNTCDGDSKSATSPSARLTVIADTPKIESVQVNATSFIPGQKATFSTAATVTDGGTLTYQWYIKGKNDTTWIAINGATGSGSSPLACKYTTDALTALQDGGRYYCIVTNTCQGLTKQNYSNSTSIAVGAPSFYIQTQPKDAIKNAGETASFSITNSMPSAGTVTYQWQYSTDGYTWDAVTAGTGGTTANYTTAALTAGDTGTQYRCVATNTLDGAKFIVNSNAATLKIQAATPTVNPQPKDTTADIGATATYTVGAAAADGGTLSYQWQCKTSGGDWANVAAGGTDASYTTGTLTASDDGAQYRCVVTNSKNGTTATATSDAAALKLNTAKPEINPQPQNLTGYISSTATFTIGATAADGGVLSYQWEKSTDGSSWSPVTGGTGGQTASYTTGTLAYTDNGAKYRCVVTNTKNGTATVTSDAASLTVQAAAPVIINQPKSAVKNIGEQAEFSVFAQVTHGTLSYQWEKSTDGGLTWNPVTGGTGGQTASYTTDALTASDTGTKYRCVVTNSDDGAQTKTTSNAAVLNIQAATPTINPQPKDTAADIGATATFTVGAAAADGGTLTYQWQKYVSGTWTDIEGAKNPGYTTGTLTASDDGAQYRCVVTNSKNETTASANSNAATLKLNTAKPAISPQPKDSSADIGETATFTVGAAAADGGTLSYQWEKSTDGGLNWNSVTGGTGGQTASYTTGTLAYADNGTKYRCVVTNTKNGTSAAVTSNAAALTVNPVAAPKGGIDCDAPVYAGQTAKITVTASVTDGGTLSYQWQKSVNGTWTDIAGAKDAVYTTGKLAVSDNGAKYRCIVTNSNNGAAKNITLDATLSVLDAAVPVITQQPANAAKDSGATAAFTVTAETADGGTLSYQWEKSTDGGLTWTAVSAGTGANSESYTTDVLTVLDNNTLYRCAVTSKNISSGKTKTVISDPASLTVGILEAPVFTVQPENATKDSGETATFTAEASVTGGGTVTYQWQISSNGKDWSNISGATGESYTTGKLAVSDSGTKYRCVAVNKKDGASAKTVSSVAVLTVVKAPDKPLDKIITSFVKLVPSVQTRQVSNGTTFASLSLPKKLEAVANEISGVWVRVKNWACNVTFDPTVAGTYVFTPEIELDSGYVLDSGAVLPEITVTVGEKSHSSGSSSSSKENTALPATVTAASTGTTVDLSGAALPAGVTGLTFETSVKGTAEKETIAVDRIFNTDKKIVTVGNPVIYQANLLDQNGAVTDVSGEVTVKLPVPSGMSGNVHVYLYNAATGTLTDMGAALQNGMLIFKTSQVNGCYAVSQISNCFITLDTHEYNMPAAGQYQIGVNLQGAEKRYMKVYSANPAVAGVIKLANGNYTATALSNGQAYIMFDVYDGKGKFLTHASTRINVVVNKKPHGDSKRQVGIFEPKL